MSGDIRSTLNGINPVDGYREDAAQGDAVALSLVNLTFVPASYKWEMIGRPEPSTAGGAGPLPISLGTAATASFTVDTDVGAVIEDGVYLIRCTLNGNSPSQQVIEAGLARMAPGVSIPGLSGALLLRKLAVFENIGMDTATPQYLAGWAKQLNRWLELIREIATTPPAPPPTTITLTNASGGAAVKGTVVRINGDGTFTLASPADAASPASSPIGVVADASIANGDDGEIAVVGSAQVKLVGSITPLAGQPLYASVTSGYATNLPPDGYYQEVIGTITDASTYAGAGTLVTAIITIPEGPALLSRSESHFLLMPSAATSTLAAPTLDISIAYLIKARVTAFTGGGLASVFELSVGWKNGLLGAVDYGIAEGTLLGSATFDNSAGQLRLRVTSPVDNVNWTCTLDILPCLQPGGA